MKGGYNSVDFMNFLAVFVIGPMIFLAIINKQTGAFDNLGYSPIMDISVLAFILGILFLFLIDWIYEKVNKK